MAEPSEAVVTGLSVLVSAFHLHILHAAPLFPGLQRPNLKGWVTNTSA